MVQSSQPERTETPTTVARTSERELTVTRSFDSPARTVFDAWTRPELFKLWWAPKSMGAGISACEMDVRAGGGYRLTFGDGPADGMTFFGRYREVEPPSRLVWTNDESDAAPLTTVTFQDRGAGTLLVLSEVYPSAEPLEEAVAGMQVMAPEQFAQLDDLLEELRAEGT